MSWLTTIFSRNRRILSYGLIAILLLALLIGRGTIRPAVGNICVTLFYYPFAEIRDSVKNLFEVAETNRRLKNSLTEASLQLNALQEARRENQRLREFLGFEPSEGYQVVPVKIISLIHNQFPIAAVINKGTDDSIEVNQSVINRFGLVGKVKEVMPDYATVQLLTDPSNAVSGRIAESRQIGIVRYVPGEGMIFDNLPADAEINTGDAVITSGLGGVYPSGLSVAIVDSVATPKGEIKKQVWLKPSVNFLEIEELYVLRSGTK